MLITLPGEFRNASDLRSAVADRDPREGAFPADELIVDARQTSFLRPAAVLWCLVYPMLARHQGRTCRFILPENMGVCLYLQSLGLFEMLKADGIDVDDR